MPEEVKSEQITAYVEPSLKEDLERRATSEGRTLSNLVAKILAEHLEAR